jgi:hypothetical protein
MNEERTVSTSAQRLWTLISDVEHWGQMLPTIERVERLTPDAPIGVGARFQVDQPGLPTAVYEITEWQPGRGFTWVASSPGIRTTASHVLSERDGATRLVLGIDWSGPLAWVVRLLVGPKARRMVEQEADTFARLAERAEESG